MSTFAEATPRVHGLYQGQVVLDLWYQRDLDDLVLLGSNGERSINRFGAAVTGVLVRDLDGNGNPELYVSTSDEKLFVFQDTDGSGPRYFWETAIVGRPWGWMQLDLFPDTPFLVMETGREVLLVGPDELGFP